MNLNDADPREKLNIVRLETLSDGVFAIVMTILVFDIRIPHVPASELPRELWKLHPYFMGYIVSFTLLGVYWIAHQTQFKYIRTSNHTLNWINIVFFASVAILPFFTRLISQYPEEILTISLYSTNMIVIGIILYIHWTYATKNFRLVENNMHPDMIRYGKIRSLLAPAGYLLAMLLAFIHPMISLIFFVIIPLSYIIPRFQKFWLNIIFKNDR